ncbi:hypothetical protein A2U01_0065790, partial [Trifolium medium]|nr:hypothetical protein [Trifolium medium]
TRPPRSDQKKNQLRPNFSKPALATAAAANSSAESSQPTFSVADIKSLLRQLLPSDNDNTLAVLSSTP